MFEILDAKQPHTVMSVPITMHTLLDCICQFSISSKPLSSPFSVTIKSLVERLSNVHPVRWLVDYLVNLISSSIWLVGRFGLSLRAHGSTLYLF